MSFLSAPIPVVITDLHGNTQSNVFVAGPTPVVLVDANGFPVTATNANANTVLAGPTSGGAAPAAFRALVAADIPTVTPTSGAYFLGPGISHPIVTSANTSLTAANQVRVALFFLPFQLTVAKVSVFLTAAGAAATTLTFGIYDSSGNKLLDSGTFDGTNAATAQTNTLGAPVTLLRGNYYFAQSATSTAIGTHTFNVVAAMATMANANTVKWGSAANAASSGVLPATLGSISAAAFSVAMPSFEV